MMLKILPLTALALGLSSGAAFADRGHGGDHRGRYEQRGDHRGGSVRDRDHGRGRGGNVVVRDHNWRGGGRVIVRGEPRYRHVDRRPIYVSRPVIRHRYYNYNRRPAFIFENYNAMPGYFWVAGSWGWNGFEWIWTAGHYEPDPNYVDYDYGYGYGNY